MDDIIPLCLYSNNVFSLITFPEKYISQKTFSYRCPQIENMNLVTVFYAINPDIKPYPTGTELICIENSNNQTNRIRYIYDPFNITVNCLRFLAWFEPTPCTIPLYIFTKGGNIFIGLQDIAPDNYEPYTIKIIHVLPSPAANLKTIHCEGLFKTEDDYPIFTFSNYMGKCIPDPNSNLSIGECMISYNKNILNPEFNNLEPGLLTYLQIKYGKTKQHKNYKKQIVLITFIILFLFVIFLYFKFKTNK